MTPTTSDEYRAIGVMLDAAAQAQEAVKAAQAALLDAKKLRAEKVAALRAQGLGSYRIAQALGVSATSVQEWTKTPKGVK